MVGAQKRKIQWAISLFLGMLFFSDLTAQAQYGGGTGTADDPLLIYTAEQMNAIGVNQDDWDKHFKLMADIDLSAFSYDSALIAPDANTVDWRFQGTPFAGVFDGNGHTISHLTIEGRSCLGLFGRLESGAEVKNLGVVDVDITGSGYVGGLVGDNDSHVTGCYSTGTVRGRYCVGGLVGSNNKGILTHCYSAGTVSATGASVGGLVGYNKGYVTGCYSSGTISGTANVGGLAGASSGGSVLNCYSTGSVSGDNSVGGLLGWNHTYGDVTQCYSTSPVCGSGWGVGGLVGDGNPDCVTYSFWDVQTSGQATSDGGTGLNTADMQTINTFLEAGWDFVDETENGTEDIWLILEGQDYPRLKGLLEGPRLWPYLAFCPNPQNAATDVIHSPVLLWAPANPTMQHDIYLGEGKQAVVDATTLSLGIYRGRQPGDVTSYDAGILEWGKTYYWRIDEVNQDDPNNPQKGNVWSFTTANFIVVDDFESYNDLDIDDPESNRIWNTWIDGYGIPTNGSMVGYESWPGEHVIVHSGAQSMPFFYSNTGAAAYSEAERTFAVGQDWTQAGVSTLVLYFHGVEDNTGQLYLKVDGSKVVYDGDAADIAKPQWKQWNINLASLGIDLQNVTKLGIGIDGNGASGTLYFDDIRLYRSTPEP